MNHATTELSLNGTAVADTFAEAFPVTGTRLVITAASQRWAEIAATEMCGNATSIIACDAEAAIEGPVDATETPDARPGVSVLVFAFSRDGLQKSLVGRVGQCVLTCPTTACFNGIADCEKEKQIVIGGQLRFFGDGFQGSKRIAQKRYWRIPVMDGEFLCEDRFGTVKGVGGGNLIICGSNDDLTLRAAEAAVAAMRKVPGAIQPFPGGLVRSGSKVGSKYKALKASTNDAYCPTLQGRTETVLPEGTRCVYEIVIDGLTKDSVEQAMRVGLHAASKGEGILLITAGNYGGKLGPHHFHLRDLLAPKA